VGSPGTSLTQGRNRVSEESRADNSSTKIADALASFTKAGHLAGPLFERDWSLYKIDRDWSPYKINPVLAVKKPEGHVCVVSNLKSPKGQSFNKGIPADRLEDWPVSMLTASNFAHLWLFAQMIVKANLYHQANFKVERCSTYWLQLL
jgi:hypothetical protein